VSGPFEMRNTNPALQGKVNMKHAISRWMIGISVLTCIAAPVLAVDYKSGDWVKMSDQQFAEAYADMAFSESLKEREVIA
jgi:hypothetical protein